MSGVIDVISRPVGESDVSFGQNSFVYVDINGVVRRINQINAKSLPWFTIPTHNVDALVDGSKAVPVGASSLAVAGTSVLSGPVFGSGTTSGYVKNYASGLFLYGQSIATADIPSGIPASSIGSGTVNDQEFGFVDGLTANAQVQLDAMAVNVAAASRLQYFQPPKAALLVYSTAATATVRANADTPAWVIMNGYPDVLNIDQFVTGGITNSVYYQVTSAVTLTFPNNLWGSVAAREQAYQWYAALAYTVSNTPLDPFDIKGTPYIRCKAEAGQVISFGTNLDEAVAVGYGFTTDEFVDGKVYVLTGTQAGELRTITANNNSDAAGTVTYSGAALNLVAGDWFIILPPAMNFRWLADIYNDGSSNITNVITEYAPRGNVFINVSSNWVCPMGCYSAKAILCGGGGGGTYLTAATGGGGGGGGYTINFVSVLPRMLYTTLVGKAGTGGTYNTFVGADGGSSLFGLLASAPGGSRGIGAAGGVAGNTTGEDGQSSTLSACGGGQKLAAAFGTGYARGGSGGAAAAGGTDGTSGFVYIEW